MRRVSALVFLGFWAMVAVAATGDSRGDGPPRFRFANPLLDTVVAMTRADVAAPTIVAYLRVRRVRLQTDVEGSDLVRLRDEGVAREVLEYISKESRVEMPPDLPPLPNPEASYPPSGDSEKAAKARPVEPDPGDTGLIMGVYDPIPTDGYPCWPAYLASYECGDHQIPLGGTGSSGRRDREPRGPEGRSPNSGGSGKSPRGASGRR